MTDDDEPSRAGAAARMRQRARAVARGLRCALALWTAWTLWGLADLIETALGAARERIAAASLRAVQALDVAACRLEAAARAPRGPWGPR